MTMVHQSHHIVSNDQTYWVWNVQSWDDVLALTKNCANGNNDKDDKDTQAAGANLMTAPRYEHSEEMTVESNVPL